MKQIRLSRKEQERGTLASLMERQQREDFTRARKLEVAEEKRQQRLVKLKKQREEKVARGRRKGGLLGLPVKKKKQGKRLSARRRIGII